MFFCCCNVCVCVHMCVDASVKANSTLILQNYKNTLKSRQTFIQIEYESHIIWDARALHCIYLT